MDVNIGAPVTALTVNDQSQLIGGPLAQGRIGDILLENDKIRVIIQQPSKFAQSCPFGGVIIDADIKRPEGTPDQDNFGKHCPLVNVEWTVNYQNFEVVSEGKDNSPQKLRAVGVIDVLDYLDLDFIAPVAKALTGQTMYFSPRFDDANDPFNTYEDLKVLNTKVVTDYTLEPGKNYVKIETTFQNDGDVPASFPAGQFVNGSGQIQTLFPGLGFTPPPTAQITGDTVAIIYVPFEGVDVSYGYFYDISQFSTEQETAVSAQKIMAGVTKAEDKKEKVRLTSTSLTYSGVTGLLFGEEFLKVLPLGSPSEVKVNFSVPPHGTRTVTQYFVVGNGNPASVFDSGLAALNILTHKVSGKVVDGDGNPVDGAAVVIQNETNTTIITYRTGQDGTFSGNLSAGTDNFSRAFGSGKYRLFMEKSGYYKDGTSVAGTCDPSEVNVSIIDKTGITCTLGSSGKVELAGGVVDADTGRKIPARLTIVGFDPSPDSHAGAAYATTHGAGSFEDTWIFERPWGVVDVKNVNAKGNFGVDGKNSFQLEPGRYAFVFSKGVEYTTFVREMTVPKDGVITIDGVQLKRVIKTPGWISADFHLHSIVSPDSAMLVERRVLASVAEGMDVLQSSDHDWLIDYGPYVSTLSATGVIPPLSVATIVGDEISPNHYGHIHVFPLSYDNDLIDGGALDWTFSPLDSADTTPDFVMSPKDIMEYYKSGKGVDGVEKVLQVNHIGDQATALPIVSSWVTTTAYKGLPALSSYIEPSAQRIMPKSPTTAIPLPFGTDDLVIADFTAIELSIGSELHSNALRETGLPQWFNLLNLGILATATANSDSHRETVDQLGLPRNYIASPIDPKDGFGTFGDFDGDAYAKAINQHKLFATAGPFVSVTAKGEDGAKLGIGDVVKGPKVTLNIEVKSPSWAWFDTIELYANTEPLPADDDGVSIFKGVASDPKSFFAPYHVPKFYYEPSYIYTISDGSLSSKEENGAITASLDVTLSVEEDTWVVVFVSGNQGTEGWRSLFPIVTKSVSDPSKMPKPESDWTLDGLVSDSRMKSSAWAFTNPVFIDVDGDTNNDGNSFESKYIKNGLSPLAK